ncbi:hypothetical protein ACFW1A_10025 [Kitasatospora sp. NPDC058965]|uniref:hypothetical protein n=1 Tax=Kitasatospora sp. NPDC058965 TaxID=3346682 RepID=UPI003688ADD4
MTNATDLTPAAQLSAAGALLGLLSTFGNLPCPDAGLERIIDTQGLTARWGVALIFPKDVSGFEQWREALDIDPATVTGHEYAKSGWLFALGEFGGAPVKLIGYYDPPKDTEQ